MAQAESAAITAQDYFAMREGPPYYQLIEGDLYMSPSPHWRHQEIALNIAAVIRAHLKSHNTGRVFIAPLDVLLSETNVYQPDVLFFYNDRELLGDRCIEGAPDFVVEILSDSTERLDRDVKRKVYARAGVKELWLVDAEERTIEIFHLAKAVDKPAAIHRGDNSFTSATFPGLTFSGAEIFRGI